MSVQAARAQAAHDKLRHLMAATRAEVRVRALEAIHDGLSRDVCVELARRGLTDRSRVVRRVAANVCRCYLLTELSTEVESAAAAECHLPTRQEMELAAGLTKDVFYRYTDDNGLPAFVIRVSDGYPARMMWPGLGWCPEPRNDREARKFAHQIRRQLTHTWRPFRWDQPARTHLLPPSSRGRTLSPEDS